MSVINEFEFGIEVVLVDHDSVFHSVEFDGFSGFIIKKWEDKTNSFAISFEIWESQVSGNCVILLNKDTCFLIQFDSVFANLECDIKVSCSTRVNP